MRPELLQKGFIPADFEIDEADYRCHIRQLIDHAGISAMSQSCD